MGAGLGEVLKGCELAGQIVQLTADSLVNYLMFQRSQKTDFIIIISPP